MVAVTLLRDGSVTVRHISLPIAVALDAQVLHPMGSRDAAISP